jgi:L-fuculose-phosphate aldolase
MDEQSARVELAATMCRLEQLGLNHNSAGNASTRVDDHLLVTPTGMPVAEMSGDDMVLLDVHGRPVREGQRRPTSEWRLHTRIAVARPDVGAVVHTHAPEATAASTLRRPVPAVHYVVARFGGVELPCAPYATYGTDELAEAVAATLGDAGAACLMANHGAIAVAADLEGAVALALDVEWLCGVHRRAVQVGEPHVLTRAEIALVAEPFRGYGQP